ncbi:general substrate transporter [Amylostereum chailletii]|nr:general substrate transporter [Amylostereum chailletii]
MAGKDLTMRAPAAKLTLYTFNCAMFAAVGSLLYGIDSGIISTTVSQPSYLKYFAPYTADISGAVVSTFGAGSFLGVMLASYTADAWGRLVHRKRTIQFAAVVALIAGAIQAGSVHIAMLIAGRILGGFAVGMMNMTIPIYNSEISPPNRRGLVSGLHAQFVGFGFAAANWIGFGCSYAKGAFQWRFPLAVQCIPALVLILGSAFLPYSPRWLLEKGQEDEALAVFTKLNASAGIPDLSAEGAAAADFGQMREQIRREREDRRSFREVFAGKGARKRLLLAVLVQVFTQLSGINVINYYQTTLYRGVGITGHTVSLLAGIYGLVGPAANVICLLYVDRWGRKKTLWISAIAMACDMALIMGLTAGYAKSDNTVGQGFTIAFIFCFSIIYSLGFNSIHYIYVPEIMNQQQRAKGSGISVGANVLINIVFNQISPRAFARVGYKYYAVFVSTNAVAAIVIFLFFVETKGRSLEDINALFGEAVYETRELPIDREHEVLDDARDIKA